MLDAYFAAFDRFLRTGSPDSLARFTAADTNPAYLDVYRNGHLKTCIDALASSFPVVHALIGDDCFRGLARAYVETQPPTSGALVGYGSDFADFLRGRSDAHGLDYLPDTAAIDAAWSASYFAEETAAFGADDVESMSADGIDVATLRVRLRPSTQLVGLRYLVAEIWARIREEGTLSRHIDLRAQQNTAMLWRLDGQIHIKALGSGESALLSNIAEGATLQAAAAEAFAVDESFDLATTFAALLENKILQLEAPRP